MTRLDPEFDLFLFDPSNAGLEESLIVKITDILNESPDFRRVFVNVAVREIDTTQEWLQPMMELIIREMKDIEGFNVNAIALAELAQMVKFDSMINNVLSKVYLKQNNVSDKKEGGLNG